MTARSDSALLHLRRSAPKAGSPDAAGGDDAFLQFLGKLLSVLPIVSHGHPLYLISSGTPSWSSSSALNSSLQLPQQYV